MVAFDRIKSGIPEMDRAHFIILALLQHALLLERVLCFPNNLYLNPGFWYNRHIKSGG